MATDRRRRRSGRLAGAGAAWLHAVAELAVAGDRSVAPARFTLDNYRTAYASADTARLFANSLQFALGSARARFLARHLAGLDQRAHQYAVQGAVLRAVDRAADHPGHSVHGVVDFARQPEDRHRQSGAAARVRHRHRVHQHLFDPRHDLGRRPALFADGVPADDGGVPRHGSGARGIGADERRHAAADRCGASR